MPPLPGKSNLGKSEDAQTRDSTQHTNGTFLQPPDSQLESTTGPTRTLRSRTTSPALLPSATSGRKGSPAPRAGGPVNHSMPVSYAYGAPSVGTPRGVGVRTRSRTPRSSVGLVGSTDASRDEMRDSEALASDDEGEEPDAHEQQDGTESQEEAFTGRARESAEIRYARLAERKRSLVPEVQETSPSSPEHLDTITSTRTIPPAAMPAPVPVRKPTAQSPQSQNQGNRRQSTSKLISSQTIPLASYTGTSVNIAVAFAAELEGYKGRMITNAASAIEPPSPPGSSNRNKKRKKSPTSTSIMVPSDDPTTEDDQTISYPKRVKKSRGESSQRSRSVAFEPYVSGPLLGSQSPSITAIEPEETDQLMSEGSASPESKGKGKARAVSTVLSQPSPGRRGSQGGDNGDILFLPGTADDYNDYGSHIPSRSPSNQDDSEMLGIGPDDSDSRSPSPPFERETSILDPTLLFSPIPSRDIREQSDSFEDSGMRDSSYDYYEEDRIVEALETQRRDRIAAALLDTPVAPRVTASRKLGNGPPLGSHLGLSVVDDNSERVVLESAEQDRPATPGNEPSIAQRISLLVTSWRPSVLGEKSLDKTRLGKWLAGALLLAMLLSAISSTSIPLLRSPTTWSAPQLPPASLAELVGRLIALESAFTRLESRSQVEQAHTQQERGRVNNILHQVSQVDKDATLRLDELKMAQAATQDAHASVLATVQSELESLARVAQQLGVERGLDAEALRVLKTKLNSVGHELEVVQGSLTQVARDVARVAAAEDKLQVALAAIAPRLPSQLFVRISATSGELEIDPALWKLLKASFIERDDPVSGAIPATNPSWSDFLTHNKASVQAWLDADMADRAASEAIISKRTLLDIMRKELKALKRDFTAQANENVQKIGEELLSKVARQAALKEDALIAARNPSTRPISDPASRSAQHITIASTEGDDVTSLIAELVDSALLRYSKDIIARPDYALFTSGGRVIPSLTSPTYIPRSTPPRSALASLLFGSPATPGRPPATALHPDNTLGSCWAFSGSSGQLGILLSRRVIPSDVTLEHAAIEVSLDAELSSAPREFEVWGVVEGEAELNKLREYRQAAEVQRQAEGRDTVVEWGAEAEQQASLPPTPHHILLAVGTYDVTASSPLQSFPVTPAARELALPVGVVVLKILSNHGDSRYTCLYRVRIGGTTVG